MTVQPVVCFHHIFEQQAARNPAAPALICGDEMMTYGALNQQANRLAHYLLRQGVTPETMIGISFQRTFEMIVSILAIFKAGAAYVPLDPEHPSSRLQYIAEETRLRLLITNRRTAPLVPDSVQAILLDKEQAQIARMPATNPAVEVVPGNLAYVIYTSGSTGVSKGVMLEHAGLTNMAREQVRVFQLTPQDRVIQLSPICFDGSLFEIAIALGAGATLCLIPEQNRMVGVSLLHCLKKYRITSALIVPSVLKLLPTEELPDLRTIIAGGEACTEELVERWCANGRRFFNAYGPTEGTIYGTVEECRPGSGTPSIGLPIRHTVARILDEQMQEVAPGAVGELYLGGIHIARGYVQAPALTAERFIPNPFADEGAARLYKTGDLALRRTDGKIEFIGRADQQIKLRGFRIDPSEIERALDAHPAIEQSCVMARSAGQRGPKKLVAYIVAAEGRQQEITAQTVQAFLGERLPQYMIPSHFVFLPALPLMLSGKVDRQSLPAPTFKQQTPSRTPIAQDEIELELKQLWREILALDEVEVGAHFFNDYAGDSLTAMELMVRIERTFKVELPIRVLFEAATISALAGAIRCYRRDQKAAHEAYLGQKIDFTEEASLDAELAELIEERAEQSSGERIFLTGANGFLGSFLLRELLDRTDAQVYCLVRARSREEGLDRVRAAMRQHQLRCDDLDARVEIVVGELGRPLLGLEAAEFYRLANNIDAIYHCAAMVNFVYPYARLKAVNVDGTREIIRLASSGREKALHHISSLAVYGSVGYFNNPNIMEEELNHLDSLHMGYAESKAVAESLVAAAGRKGLPVNIYRLDDVIGHSKTGIWNTDDFICRYVKGCLQLGAAPQLNIRINAIPVDYMARIIVHLSRQERCAGKSFNLTNPHAVTQRELFDYFAERGHELKRLPFAQWKELLVERVSRDKDNSLYPLMPLFTERHSEYQLTLPEMYEEERRPGFSRANVIEGLQGSDISIPMLDDELLRRYYQYFIESGFLTAPPEEENVPGYLPQLESYSPLQRSVTYAEMV